MAIVTIASPGAQTKELYGLVINESFSGCAIVLLTEQKLKKDMLCHCRVGRLDELPAAVRWTKVLDKGVIKVGIEYLG